MPQISSNITKEHVEEALEKIKLEGTPKANWPKTKQIKAVNPFAPKHTIRLAAEIANAEVPSDFTTNDAIKHLESLGFVIEEIE